MSSFTIISSMNCSEFFNQTNKRRRIATITEKQKDWQIYKAELGNISQGKIRINPCRYIYGSDKLSPSGQALVYCKVGHRKMVLTSQRKDEYLEWPETVISMSRRIFERQTPPQTLSTRFWPENNREQMFYGQVEDISTGGLSVSGQNREYPEGIFRCVVTKDLITEVILRKTEPISDKRMTLHFQFIGLELEPRLHKLRELIKLVRTFQRAS